MEQLAILWEPVRRTFTVSELNARLRALMANEFDDIWVAGEISGCKTAGSGHCYFTLKDEQAQLRCVCFRSSMRFLKFKPRDGVAVLARGRLDLFDARGEYQLLVEALEPQGYGALQFAFEQLKKKLAAEGLFDQSRKRALPRYPQRIGIVTSPTGAVLRDIANILLRRFPGLHLRLYPALVQGDGSLEAVCRGLQYFSTVSWADVVILARGGGSLEDLWTFNEEAVARAIAACSVPVISAVGHETDFTISDFVADLRAPTPSAAAELVICTREQLLEQIDAARQKLMQAARYRLAMASQRLHHQAIDRAASLLHRYVGRKLQRVDELEYRLRDAMGVHLRTRKARLDAQTNRLKTLDLQLRLANARRRLDVSANALDRLIHSKLGRSQAMLAPLAAHLTQLSPLKILDRGYAIVTNAEGRIVKTAREAPPNSRVQIRLAHDILDARIEERKSGLK